MLAAIGVMPNEAGAEDGSGKRGGGRGGRRKAKAEAERPGRPWVELIKGELRVEVLSKDETKGSRGFQ